jgi:hypothetical protein
MIWNHFNIAYDIAYDVQHATSYIRRTISHIIYDVVRRTYDIVRRVRTMSYVYNIVRPDVRDRTCMSVLYDIVRLTYISYVGKNSDAVSVPGRAGTTRRDRLGGPGWAGYSLDEGRSASGLGSVFQDGRPQPADSEAVVSFCCCQIQFPKVLCSRSSDPELTPARNVRDLTICW